MRTFLRGVTNRDYSEFASPHDEAYHVRLLECSYQLGSNSFDIEVRHPDAFQISPLLF